MTLHIISRRRADYSKRREAISHRSFRISLKHTPGLIRSAVKWLQSPWIFWLRHLKIIAFLLINVRKLHKMP